MWVHPVGAAGLGLALLCFQLLCGNGHSRSSPRAHGETPALCRDGLQDGKLAAWCLSSKSNHEKDLHPKMQTGRCLCYSVSGRAESRGLQLRDSPALLLQRADASPEQCANILAGEQLQKFCLSSAVSLLY